MGFTVFVTGADRAELVAALRFGELAFVIEMAEGE